MGRRAQRRRLPRVRAAAHAAHLRGDWARGADHPLRHRHGAPSSQDLREAGGDVIGVDWRIPIDVAWERIGHDRAVQGNLDPTLLLGPTQRMFGQTDDILARVGGRPGHIFNLGHGILPSTPVEHVQMLAQYVHSASRRTMNVRANLSTSREGASRSVNTNRLDVLDVAVVGGGIAGLAAAYELQRRGLGVRVLEAIAAPGGVILTERFDGWVIDGGSRLAARAEAGGRRALPRARPRRLASSPRCCRARPTSCATAACTRIVEGSFLGFPVSAVGARALVALHVGRQAADGLRDRRPARSRRMATSRSPSFVRRRFGEEAVDYLAEPLLAGIHAGDVDRLSMRALFPRLLDAERQSGSVHPLAPRAARCARRRTARSCRCPAASASSSTRSRRALPPGTRRLSSARHASCAARRNFIGRLAGAARFAARAVDPRRPGLRRRRPAARRRHDARRALRQMPYASTATVAFGYRRDADPSPACAARASSCRASSTWPLLAATWVTSKWPGRAPDGHALLRAFLGGGRDPHRLERSDEDLIAEAQDELERVLDIDGAACLHAPVPLDAPESAVRSRPSAARRRNRAAAGIDPRPVPGGQRLPRDRHPRLHRRRPRHGGRRSRRSIVDGGH